MKKLLFVLFMFTLLFANEVKLNENPTEITLKPASVNEIDEDLDFVSAFEPIGNKLVFINMQAKMVFIYDENGKFIKVLDAIGKGPGEFSLPATLRRGKNNEIGVFDNINRRTCWFDTNGNHIKDEKVAGYDSYLTNSYINSKKMLDIIMYVNVDTKNQKVIIKPTFKLIDGEKEKIISESSLDAANMSISDNTVSMYSHTKKNIFVTNVSKRDYKIKVYDTDANLLYTLSKKVKPVKFKGKELKEIESKLEMAKKQMKAAGSQVKIDFGDYNYKPLISGLNCDSKGRLWVFAQDKDGMFFDVIENKKLIKKVKLEHKNISNAKVLNNKIYTLDGDEENGYTLNIYNINF